MMSGRPAPDSSSLLAPRWILVHALVVALAGGLVALGVWQLQRRAEVDARQARIDAGLAADPVPLAEIAARLDRPGVSPADLEYRRVRVEGTWVPADEVLQRSRSHRGRSGWHVLTPLALDDGRGVLVRRGWIPREVGEDHSTPPGAAPPRGTVTVTGFLERPDRQPDLLGPRDPAEGTLEAVFHADVSRLDRQTDPALLPVVLHLQSQDPAQSGRLPVPADPPELDDTRHLSYAVQWFSFALIGVVGYGAFLRRRHHGDGGHRPDGPPDGPPGPSDGPGGPGGPGPPDTRGDPGSEPGGATRSEGARSRTPAGVG